MHRVLSHADQVRRLAHKQHTSPQLLHVLLIVIAHLFAGHIAGQALDLVLVLRDNAAHVVQFYSVSDGCSVAAPLERHLFLHVPLDDLVEADLCGGANFGAEYVTAEWVVYLPDLFVHELLRQRTRVITHGVGLTTEGGHGTPKGHIAEIHRHFGEQRADLVF